MKKRINIKGIYQSLGKKCWDNIWIIFILFLILDILFAFVLHFNFYKGVQSVQTEALSRLRIKKTLLNDFSSYYLEKEMRFTKAKKQEFCNIFNSSFSIPAPQK